LDSYGFSAMSREERDYQQGKVVEKTLGFVLPKGETLLNPDSIGILKGAPHLELAQLFVEYNLSEEGGQRLWMLKPGTLPGSPQQYSICRFSIIPAMYDLEKYPLADRSISINPFDHHQIGKLVHFDNRLADDRRQAVADLFGTWIVDTQRELAAAWRAILQSRPERMVDDPLEKQLFSPPYPENEITHLNAELRKSPKERATLIAQWLREARNRYSTIRADAEARR
jgi:hypothetical protein